MGAEATNSALEVGTEGKVKKLKTFRKSKRLPTIITKMCLRLYRKAWPQEMSEEWVLCYFQNLWVSMLAGGQRAGSRWQGTETRDAPRPGFPQTPRIETSRYFTASSRLRHPTFLAVQSPTPWQKWPPQQKCAELTRASRVRGPGPGRLAKDLSSRPKLHSLPRLGPKLPPFHTQPPWGPRRSVESIAACSLPTSELNSCSLRTETFLSRTILTPTQGSATSTSRSTDTNDLRGLKHLPQGRHVWAGLVEIANVLPIEAKASLVLCSHWAYFASIKEISLPASPATPPAL